MAGHPQTTKVCGVMMVLQWFCIGVTMVLSVGCVEVIVLLHGVTVVLHECFDGRDVERKCHLFTMSHDFIGKTRKCLI
jgi:hypothetical protein